MKLSQKYVSRLLGFQDTTMLSRYEHGRSVPPLPVALRLEIIYRVPVAFLFLGQYELFRKEIRTLEDGVAGRGQQTLL